MRWFDEVRDGDREFHFSECMEAQAILPRCENESAEALKRRTLAFEDAALKLADEQARSGGPPKLNVAINAFNIAGLKVPDPEKGDEMVAVGHTQKSYRRRVATILGRTCVQTAAVALAEAGLRSARAFYYEAIEKAWVEALEGRISIDSKRDIRLATTHATRAAAGAVDRMYTLAGGTSVYRRSPLQRIFRDVHVATQHMMVGPATLELTGRLLLGLETSEVGL